MSSREVSETENGKKEASFFEEPVDFGRPIVTRGRIFCFPLKSPIRHSRIGAGDCTSIVWDDQNSAFYGLVIGPESHLFFFDSNSTVEDVGRIDAAGAGSGFLVFDGRETLLCAVADGNGDTRLFIHNVNQERRMYSHMWGHFAMGPIEPLEAELRGERLVAGCPNPGDGRIVLLSQTGRIFRLDPAGGKPEAVAEVESRNLSAVLCADPDSGDLYGVSGRGRIWRLRDGAVQPLEARVPCMKNRDYVAQCSSLVWSGDSMFGSTTQDAYLFEYRVREGIVRNLGRPDENTEIRGIDVLPDGRIFGITACRERGMGHLFGWSPRSGFADLGVIHGWQPVQDFAYQPLCIKAGSSGDFLIGNGERRGNVFLFCSFPER